MPSRATSGKNGRRAMMWNGKRIFFIVSEPIEQRESFIFLKRELLKLFSRLTTEENYRTTCWRFYRKQTYESYMFWNIYRVNKLLFSDTSISVSQRCLTSDPVFYVLIDAWEGIICRTSKFLISNRISTKE